MELLKDVPDIGPAAVEALQLCSLVAPDKVPVELVARGGMMLPPVSPLRCYLTGSAEEVSGDDGPPVECVRQAEAVVALLARHSLVNPDRGCGTDTVLPCISMHRLMQEVVAEDLLLIPTMAQALCCSLLQAVKTTWTNRVDNWHRSIQIAEVWCTHVLWMARHELATNLLLGNHMPAVAELMQSSAECLRGLGHCEDGLLLATLCCELRRRQWGAGECGDEEAAVGRWRSQ
jgi:hypothetical protein